MAKAVAKTRATPKPTLTSLKVYQHYDQDPDTSWIGQYTDDVTEDWAILRATGQYIKDLPDDFEMPERGREYRAFLPYAGGEKPGSKDYREYGLKDFERMEELQRGDWHFLGIKAVATITMPSGTVQRFESGGLWGIESTILVGVAADSGADYFTEVAAGEIDQLAEDLLAIGIDAEVIEAAKAAALKAGLKDG